MRNVKLIWSMSGVNWVWSNKGSSFFEEVVELSVFSSGVVVLPGLVGDSWDSDVYFGKFFKGKSLSRAKFLLFWLGLFSEINKKVTLIQRWRLRRWCLILFTMCLLLSWFVWCNYFWVRKWTIGQGGCCMWAIHSLCRVDRPFFFPELMKWVTPPCLMSSTGV